MDEPTTETVNMSNTIRNTNRTGNAAEMVFMVGSPAAGKSTVSHDMFDDTHTFIDSDAWKQRHPDYDPTRPHLVHEWSAEMAARQLDDAIESGRGRWVVDGTGASAEKTTGQMDRARAAGFHIRVVYVRCTLDTSLRRNAARERNVPEEIVREKWHGVQHSYPAIADAADNATVIDNDTDHAMAA